MRLLGRRVFALAAALILSVMVHGVSTMAQEVNQIQLTEAQVKGFIASQTDLTAISGKLQDAGEKPDAALDRKSVV